MRVLTRVAASLANVAALLGLCVAALGALGRVGWRFELFLHWTPVAGLVMAVLLPVFLRRRIVALLMVAAIVWSASLVVPLYVPPGSSRGPVAAVMRVASINLAGNESRPEEVIRWIRAEEPDVLALEELTSEGAIALGTLVEAYPCNRAVPRSDTGGIAVASRWPLRKSEVFQDGAGMPQIEAEVETPGGVVTVVVVHALPPIGGDGARLNVGLLTDVAARARRAAGPVVVAGDFNQTPWSASFSNLLEAGGLDHARRGRGLCVSWPDTPLFPVIGIPIDHVLIRGPLEVEAFETGPSIGSDHVPVIARIRIFR